MTGIWIAERVSDDHRKVIDWLNDNTPAKLSFYLAEIKAYRIESSAAAPELDVLSRPNIQTKIARSSGDDSEAGRLRHQWRREFWSEILEYIKSKRPSFRLQSPSDDAWTNISVGRSNFWIALTLTPRRQCIGCELSFDPPWKDHAFAQLSGQRSAIEAEIGQELDWRPMPGRKSARILVEASIDPKNDENRTAIKDWFHQTAVRFHNAFANRVKQLVVPSPTSALVLDSEVERLDDE